MAATLDQEVGDQISKIINKAEDDTVKSARHSTKVIYDDLLLRSPIFSGYYKSNHRILIRSGGGQFKKGAGASGTAKLFPSERPPDAKRLQFEENIETARQEELNKLDSLQLGDIIVFTTNVPYADQLSSVYTGLEASITVGKEI